MELVIASFVIVSLGGAWGGVPEGEGAGGGWVWVSALGWVVAAGATWAWCVRAGVRLDRRGDVRAAWSAERACAWARAAAVGLLAWNVVALGWVGVVRGVVGDLVVVDEVVAVMPVLLVVVMGWWAVEPIDRRFREAAMVRMLDEGTPMHAPPTRWGYVWRRVRMEMLAVLVPVVVVMGLGEVLSRAWPWTGLGAGWLSAAQVAGVVVVLAVSPAMLRLVWSTSRLTAGPVRGVLERVCAASGVRVRDFLVWRTGGTVHNAAVVGVLPGLRYILVTDGLLERMPEEELEAVAMHEVAHVRHRHLAWLVASVVGSMGTAGVAGSWAAWALGASGAWAEAGVVGAGLLAGVGMMGAVSRRFEWQADASAASGLSGDGAAVTARGSLVMIAALERVSALSGLDPARFTWRHGSIRERQARLRAMVGVARGSVPIDAEVARWKRASAALVVIAAVGVALDPTVLGAVG
ncbi:MAG: M48 family metalloprotease [Phycisphaeraceae bacterium]|nr:MAG: M48 family metalloprotease [Phycisphaeraceae bacterium]